MQDFGSSALRQVLRYFFAICRGNLFVVIDTGRLRHRFARDVLYQRNAVHVTKSDLRDLWFYYHLDRHLVQSVLKLVAVLAAKSD